MFIPSFEKKNREKIAKKGGTQYWHARKITKPHLHCKGIEILLRLSGIVYKCILFVY
jgi:hypothetical protein